MTWGSDYWGLHRQKDKKGRTIKVFVLDVLIIPSLVTFAWSTTFGGASVHLVYITLEIKL